MEFDIILKMVKICLYVILTIAEVFTGESPGDLPGDSPGDLPGKDEF